MIIMKDYPRGKIDGRREAYRKIEEMIDKIELLHFDEYDGSEWEGYIEIKELKQKLHSLVNGQGQDTGDGQGFGSVETIGDVSDGNHLCRENKSGMGSEWSLSPDIITWEEVIKKLEEV